MTDSASFKPGNDTNGFVSNADWIPGFWNYLLDLKAENLIAELIQNDLDQDATRTVVSFEEDRLICEGNGRPVDEQGWERLRVIQGVEAGLPRENWRARPAFESAGSKLRATWGVAVHSVVVATRCHRLQFSAGASAMGLLAPWHIHRPTTGGGLPC